MSITSAMVLYCVIWALIFYLINPLWQVSQSESGEVEPGTPASAPVDAMVRKKAILTTIIGTALFALIFSALQFGWVSLDDLDFLKLPSQR
jgi:predicted secreted protein